MASFPRLPCTSFTLHFLLNLIAIIYPIIHPLLYQTDSLVIRLPSNTRNTIEEVNTDTIRDIVNQEIIPELSLIEDEEEDEEFGSSFAEFGQVSTSSETTSNEILPQFSLIEDEIIPEFSPPFILPGSSFIEVGKTLEGVGEGKTLEGRTDTPVWLDVMGVNEDTSEAKYETDDMGEDLKVGEVFITDDEGRGGFESRRSFYNR